MGRDVTVDFRSSALPSAIVGTLLNNGWYLTEVPAGPPFHYEIEFEPHVAEATNTAEFLQELDARVTLSPADTIEFQGISIKLMKVPPTEIEVVGAFITLAWCDRKIMVVFHAGEPLQPGTCKVDWNQVGRVLLYPLQDAGITVERLNLYQDYL